MSKWNQMIQSHISRSFKERTEYIRSPLALKYEDRGVELAYKHINDLREYITDKNKIRRTYLVDKKTLYLKRIRPARDLPLEFKLITREFEPANPI